MTDFPADPHRCIFPNFDPVTSMYSLFPAAGTHWTCRIRRCRARWIVAEFTDRGRARNLRHWLRLYP